MRKCGALAVVALLVAATMAQAGVTSVDAVVRAQSALPGHTVNDILLDFEGNLRGQQMILTLTAGSIYQDAFGSNTAPNGALFPPFPTSEFDTYVTIGGNRSDGPVPPASHPVLVVGGAVNLEAGAVLKFDTAGINVAWAPGTGVDIPMGTDFMTARLTLSNDAQGVISYFGSTTAAAGDPLGLEGTVVNGAISFGTLVDPPVVTDFHDPTDLLNKVVNKTLEVTNTPVTWSGLDFISYTPGFGALNPVGAGQAPDWDPITGTFNWDTSGSTRGTYVWNATASNDGGSDVGVISVDVTQIPEPATFALLGLALVGFAGFRRK